ncbi:MAG: OsmC family protein, partial [Verrucomicrobiota bacterium]
MSEHKVKLAWKRDNKEFAYKTYSRNHSWEFENGATLQASAAVDFLGDASCVDPEAAFTASLSSCHMLTFLAIAAMRKIGVESYTDHAVGHLGKGPNGKPIITRVDLYPKIVFAEGQEPDRDALEKLHHLS